MPLCLPVSQKRHAGIVARVVEAVEGAAARGLSVGILYAPLDVLGGIGSQQDSVPTHQIMHNGSLVLSVVD